MKPTIHTEFVGRTGLSLIRDKGERLVDAKTKKLIFNLALQSEAVTVKKQATH